MAKKATGPALSNDPPVRYSDTEREMFGCLLEHGNSIASDEITSKWYRNEVPWNGRTMVRGILDALRRKMEINGEKWVIRKTRRAGPTPVSYWIERRPKSEKAA